ncbi:MAG: hypothetical protein RR075_05130 [Pygmaiobacter sp.]
MLAALWCSGVSLLCGIALWLLFTAFWGLLAGALLCILSVSLCFLHRLVYRVELRGKQLVITRGFFIRSIIKIPLRFITGTTRLSTPLSRALGVGLLTISSSGRFTLLCGLRLEDITALRSFLTERQGTQ